MLNYETILSSYDDKLTLMQWLKKVEAALANASMTSLQVENRGNATFVFIATFADGSTMESDPVAIAQGDSVASAYISSGNLHLVLTNGDDIDAGNMFNGDVNVAGNISATGDISASGGISSDSVTCNDLEVNNSAQVNGDLSVTNDLNAGNITGDSIVENMTGFAFVKNPALTFDVTPIYVGACKNGNKLTLVIFGTYTYASGDVSAKLGDFTIPSSVGVKLYPYTSSTENKMLDQKQVAFYSSRNTHKDCNMEIVKYSNTDLEVTIINANDAGLTDGTTYTFRYEVTFLLSENLAA